MAKSSSNKLSLVVAEEKRPSVPLKAGQRLDVVAVELIKPNPKIKATLGARLCGGTSTCLALIQIDKGDPEP